MDTKTLTDYVTALRDLFIIEDMEAVKHSTVPTLFIHGEEDKMIPSAMVQELYDAASCEKDLLLVPGAGHVQAVDVAPEEYYDAIGRFTAFMIIR